MRLYRATALSLADGSVDSGSIDVKNRMKETNELIKCIDSTLAIIDKMTAKDLTVKIELMLLKGLNLAYLIKYRILIPFIIIGTIFFPMYRENYFCRALKNCHFSLCSSAVLLIGILWEMVN